MGRRKSKTKRKSLNIITDVIIPIEACLFMLYFLGAINENVIGYNFALVILYALIKLYSVIHKKNRIRASGIKEIDKMNGVEFEQYLKLYFENLGYRVKLTAKTADYGCDLVIQKDGVKTAVQAKRYSSKVGIRAVQEVIGSIKYYNADKGLVVTNSYFTNNAKELASINQVDLWDREVLIGKIVKKKS